MLEWKKIGESCKTVSPPKKLEKELYGEEGLYPIIDQGQKDIVGYTFDESALVPNGEYILFGDHTRYVKYHKGVFAQGADGLKILRAVEGVLPRYLYFAFANTEVPSRGYSRHWSIAKELLIPIPSLSEQSRVVSILDTFTASIENLKRQIAQRRKQYEHYRDQLLDLVGKEGVEMKTLKEAFDTRNGYTPSTSNSLFWKGGTIPWFKMEDIRDNGRILNDSNLHITPNAIKGKGLFKANSVILATSATIGEHALITVDHLCNQRFTNFYPKKDYLAKIDMKFVYYYMFIIDEWCKQHINQGGFASVDMAGLYNLYIPVPSLPEQQRIVSILDTFEASIANLEQQLAQREKQYEYYRNKLLTFE